MFTLWFRLKNYWHKHKQSLHKFSRCYYLNKSRKSVKKKYVKEIVKIIQLIFYVILISKKSIPINIIYRIALIVDVDIEIIEQKINAYFWRDWKINWQMQQY